MAFAPSASWNSRSITHLANYPSPSLPIIFSDESIIISVGDGDDTPDGTRGRRLISPSVISAAMLGRDKEVMAEFFPAAFLSTLPVRLRALGLQRSCNSSRCFAAAASRLLLSETKNRPPSPSTTVWAAKPSLLCHLTSCSPAVCSADKLPRQLRAPRLCSDRDLV